MAPLALFVLVYLATFLAVARSVVRLQPALSYWAFFVSAATATAVTIAVAERGRWSLGLAAPVIVALRETVGGAMFAAVVLGAADLAIITSTDLRHLRNDGFPWSELVVVFIPAVLHEELLFRGYVYQKLRQANHPLAVLLMALVFAGLHGGNAGITALALVNLFVAGILLAFAYDRYERLWFPIGLHLAWNLVSGPILGYNVSGYASRATILRTVGSGPPALTGGVFGVEGSALTLGVMVVAAVLLGRANAEGRMQKAE